MRGNTETRRVSKRCPAANNLCQPDEKLFIYRRLPATSPSYRGRSIRRPDCPSPPVVRRLCGQRRRVNCGPCGDHDQRRRPARQQGQEQQAGLETGAWKPFTVCTATENPRAASLQTRHGEGKPALCGLSPALSVHERKMSAVATAKAAAIMAGPMISQLSGFPVRYVPAWAVRRMVVCI